ncbi:Kelch repeat-containing protein [Fibrella sp. WM1]|uniref:Kelch repeat-containing protein n=1 Tax=Fibrella musci TaxID=3242485 RepID=UPI00351FF67C
MNRYYTSSLGIGLLLILGLSLQNCKKDDPATPTGPTSGTTTPGTSTTAATKSTSPVLLTDPVVGNVGSFSARITAVINGNGGEAITGHKVIVVETATQRLGNQYELGATSGPFPLTITQVVTGLAANTNYTVYFTATNKVAVVQRATTFTTTAITSTTTAPNGNGITVKAPFPGQSRRLARTFTLANKLYVLGGSDQTQATAADLTDLWQYDPAADKWSQKASLLVPKALRLDYTLPIMLIDGQAHALVTVQTGTTNSTRIPFVYTYDPATDKWTAKGQTPFVGSSRTVLSLNGKGYAVGGGDQLNTPLSVGKQVWQYDPATDKWTRRNDFPGEARYGGFGTVYNNKGYLIGGTGLNQMLADMWEYNDATDSWTQKAAPPTIVSNGAFSGKAYLVGDKLTFTQFADKYYTYNFTTQSWSTAPSPDAIYKSPLGGTGCTVYEYLTESIGANVFLFHQYRSVSGTSCLNLMGQFWQYTP